MDESVDLVVDKIIKNNLHWDQFYEGRLHTHGWKWQTREECSKILEHLRKYADQGNINAIMFILKMCAYEYSGISLKFDVVLKYCLLAKTTYYFLSETFTEPNLRGLMEYFLKEFGNRQKNMDEMEKQIEKLKAEIAFLPGGIGYQEAKREFESIAKS